jgi:transposase-like protein
MSKIPQGEWNAIAQRYSNGESLSSIARHYGCTPPAIHYILQRVKRPSTDTAESRVVAKMQPAAKNESRRCPEDVPTARIVPPIPARKDTSDQAQPLPPGHPRSEKGERPSSFAARSAPHGQRLVAAPPTPLGAGRAPALEAELDRELQSHTESAIQEFRSSFAAVLGGGSPASRARLRQAAADLMRAAARTTIVLDRVNADAKRAPLEATD